MNLLTLKAFASTSFTLICLALGPVSPIAWSADLHLPSYDNQDYDIEVAEFQFRQPSQDENEHFTKLEELSRIKQNYMIAQQTINARAALDAKADVVEKARELGQKQGQCESIFYGEQNGLIEGEQLARFRDYRKGLSQVAEKNALSQAGADLKTGESIFSSADQVNRPDLLPNKTIDAKEIKSLNKLSQCDQGLKNSFYNPRAEQKLPSLLVDIYNSAYEYFYHDNFDRAFDSARENALNADYFRIKESFAKKELAKEFKDEIEKGMKAATLVQIPLEHQDFYNSFYKYTYMKSLSEQNPAQSYSGRDRQNQSDPAGI